MPEQSARKACYLNFRAGRRIGLAALLFFFGSESLETAIANGDTRTLSFHHLHTGEDLIVTFKRDGKFDDASLEKLNHLMRDWRVEQPIKMDPYLFDLIWEVNREVGGKEPIQIVCGYRSPSTNAMLRASSRGVAQFSQHMLGKAMDFFIPGVDLTRLRETGLRLQRGGVGFYPTSGSPFVHLDTGNVRHWPKVSREYLSRLFPDGKTIHIPEDGRPMPGYQLALAEIHSRGQQVVPTAYASRGDAEENETGANGGGLKRLFASIFKKKNEGEDEDSKDSLPGAAPAVAAKTKTIPDTAARPVAVASISSGPQMQWSKGPDAVVTGSVAPIPRARPMEARANTFASLPLNGRKVASVGDDASLPLAITGGEKPASVLSYAASDGIQARPGAPTTEPAASASRPKVQQEAARWQETIRSPGFYGDAARSPTFLLGKQPIQFTAELKHPDQTGLTVLLDPVATTAGYFAHQSGGKIVTSAN